MSNYTTADCISKLANNYSNNFTGFRKFLVAYRHKICPFEAVLCRIPDNATLLDIGCGAGFLLYAHTQRKLTLTVAGIDSNTQLLETAQKFIKKSVVDSNFKIYTSKSFEGLPVKQFDVVTLIDVLHHIPEDKQNSFLQQSASMVKPGGRLIYKDICGENLFYATANRLHDLLLARQWVHYYPIKSVIKELEAKNFVMVSKESYKMYFYKHEMIVMDLKD